MLRRKVSKGEVRFVLGCSREIECGLGIVAAWRIIGNPRASNTLGATSGRILVDFCNVYVEYVARRNESKLGSVRTWDDSHR